MDRLPPNTAKPGSAFDAPLANFYSLRYTPLFGLAAFPRPISPRAGSQPKRSVTLKALEISKRAKT